MARLPVVLSAVLPTLRASRFVRNAGSVGRRGAGTMSGLVPAAARAQWEALASSEAALPRAGKGVRPSEEVVAALRELRAERKALLASLPPAAAAELVGGGAAFASSSSAAATATAAAATAGAATAHRPVALGRGDAEPNDASRLLELDRFAIRDASGSVMELVDIGINVHSRASAGSVFAQLERALSAGVRRVLLTGTSLESSRAALSLCAEWYGGSGAGSGSGSSSALRGGFQRAAVRVYATVGVHPHDASTLMTPAPDCASALSSAVSTSLLSELRRLAADPHCVSLGECGLDYERMLSPRAAQLAAFEAQVSLAAELGRPLFVHLREVDPGREPLGAYRDAAAVLRRHYGTRLRPERVCVHCFTGSAADLAQLCEMGVRVGLTGYVSLTARAEATGTLAALRTAGLLPLDRVMLETDSPFMLPAKGLLTDGARALAAGRQNEPCALPAVCRAVALAMGLPAPDVAAQTTRTALDFFGLVEADSAIERLHSRGQSHVAKTQKH